MATLRKAFNNTTDLKLAFKWTQPQLFDFLGQVKLDPTKFGIKADVQTDAKRCIDLITKFDYKNPQKLRVFTDTRAGKLVLKPEEFKWKGVLTPFFSVFDCFGYITSLMSTATPDATREDYFIPLLSVFSKNLANLGGTNDGPNYKLAPNRAFIAYNDLPYEQRDILFAFDVPDKIATPPSELDVALGANIEPGVFKSGIQMARWQWMVTEGKLVLPPYNLSKVRQTLGGTGQLYGHCAETFPLIVKLVTTDTWRMKYVSGICINVTALSPDKEYAVTPIHQHLVDPCPNCQEVLNQFKANPENFKANVMKILNGIKA